MNYNFLFPNKKEKSGHTEFTGKQRKKGKRKHSEKCPLPAGIGNRSNAGNGAVKEDGQEGGPADVYRQAPNKVVVFGDPIGHPFPPRRWTPVAPI